MDHCVLMRISGMKGRDTWQQPGTNSNSNQRKSLDALCCFAMKSKKPPDGTTEPPCTVLVYAIVVLEYGYPDLMSSSVLGLELRAWGKIVWGCLTAVVVFVSGYYGRLSFERKAFDHEKMALLFAAAARRYETAPEEYEAVFRDLAREEIIENGNWMSYCKEDRPTFSL